MLIICVTVKPFLTMYFFVITVKLFSPRAIIMEIFSHSSDIRHGCNSLKSLSSMVPGCLYMFHWAVFSQLGSLFSIMSCQGMFVSLLNDCLSSCQTDCCVHRKCLFLMHHSSAGSSSNLLNWCFDSSMLYISRYFSSLPRFHLMEILIYLKKNFKYTDCMEFCHKTTNEKLFYPSFHFLEFF